MYSCDHIALIILTVRNVPDESDGERQFFLLNNSFFPRKSYRLLDNVEKYDSAGQATDDSIIRRMRTACRITKAADTNSESK
jgi:hypothetical protein